MTRVVTAVKVETYMDWEGIYVDGIMGHEDHTAKFTRINLGDDTAIGEIDSREVEISHLGINRLPRTLEDLEHRIEFADTVKNNKDEWENRIRDAIDTFDKHPLKEDLCDELDVTDAEFRVLEGIFMPHDVFDNRTVLGDEALLSRVVDEESEVDGEIEYILMEHEHAKSYE